MNLLREYIRELLHIREGVGGPKVIFMAGGPGSGKSAVGRELEGPVARRIYDLFDDLPLRREDADQLVT